MNKQIEALSINEYKTVGDMLLNVIAQCPHIPKGLVPQINSRATEKSVGIFSLGGSKYVEKYIDGGFKGQIQFEVSYKSFPTSNGQRINAQAVVDDIMSWLENLEELPSLSDDRKITEITATNSSPFVDEVGEDKSTVFAAFGAMEYKKKGAKQ